MQKIITMSTTGEHPNSEAIGWSGWDSNFYVPNGDSKYPGRDTPAPKFNYCYPCVLAALADGWKLLAPPKEYIQHYDSKDVTEYSWWLVKD